MLFRSLFIRSMVDQSLIVYPKTPRPSFADHVLSILSDHGVHPKTVYEVSDLQTALGLVAADKGICIAPESTRIFRSDLHYRILDDKYATSPIIMSHRIEDKSPYINLTKDLAAESFAEEQTINFRSGSNMAYRAPSASVAFTPSGPLVYQWQIEHHAVHHRNPMPF